MKQKKQTRIKIRIIDIILFIFFMIAMEIDSIAYITNLSNTVIGYFSMAVCLLSFILCLSNKGISKICILILCFFTWYIIISFYYNPKSIVSAFRTVSSPLAITLLIEYCMKKKIYRVVDTIEFLCISLTIIDIITIILFPKGLYSSSLYWNNWFLGYKSARVRAVGIPGVVFTTLNTVKKKKNINWRYFFIVSFYVIDAYLSGALAGTISLLFYVAIVILLFMKKRSIIYSFSKTIINPRFVLIIIIVLNLMFAFFQKYEIFAYIITEILDKSITLANRDRIWNTSIRLFLQHPICGNGIISGLDYMMHTGVRGGTQPHNMFLGILVYEGIVGLLMYLLMLIRSTALIDVDNPRYTVVIFFGVLTYILFGITSMTTYAQFHYAFFVMIYYCSLLEKTEII